MPKKRLSVHKIREILRLRYEAGLSERKIAASCRVSRSTVAEYLRRAGEAGITWPLPEALDEQALVKRHVVLRAKATDTFTHPGRLGIFGWWIQC